MEEGYSTTVSNAMLVIVEMAGVPGVSAEERLL